MDMDWGSIQAYCALVYEAALLQMQEWPWYVWALTACAVVILFQRFRINRLLKKIGASAADRDDADAEVEKQDQRIEALEEQLADADAAIANITKERNAQLYDSCAKMQLVSERAMNIVERASAKAIERIAEVATKSERRDFDEDDEDDEDDDD